MVQHSYEVVARGRGRARLHAACRVLLVALAAMASLWAFGAVYYDAPWHASTPNLLLAAAWLAVTAVLVALAGRPLRRLLAWSACFLVVLIPWLFISASNDRQWQPQWANLAWAEIDGDLVTVHHVRDFDHGEDGAVTERWETRTVRLSNLRGVDLFLDAFGGDYIAHPMLSYDFGPDGRLVVSIETRREVGESFSEFGGLYKMFELQYLVGTERDFVRVRSNVRGEPIYLYALRASPLEVRATFLETLRGMNTLRSHPRFYNLITHNCTTSYIAQTPTDAQERFDYRMLVNGKLDAMLYDQNHLVSDGLPFVDLREQALINDVALQADDLAFSERIREGRVGF